MSAKECIISHKVTRDANLHVSNKYLRITPSMLHFKSLNLAELLPFVSSMTKNRLWTITRDMMVENWNI